MIFFVRLSRLDDKQASAGATFAPALDWNPAGVVANELVAVAVAVVV